MLIMVIRSPPHNQDKYPSWNKLSDPNIVGKRRCHRFLAMMSSLDILFMEYTKVLNASKK